MRQLILSSLYVFAAVVFLTRCASTPTPDSNSKPPLKTDAEINLNEFLTEARYAPYPNQKQQEGILVTHMEPNSAVGRLGIQNGDVILRVGDKPMTDKLASLDLFRAIANPGSRPIEVLRKSAKSKKRERMVLPNPSDSKGDN